MYNILQISERAAGIFPRSGTVSGIYGKCFNILTDGGELLTIFSDTDEKHTRSLISDVKCDMRFLPVENGMRVSDCGDVIYAGETAFSVKNPAVFSVKRKSVKKASDIASGIKNFKASLEKYGVKSGLGADFRRIADFLDGTASPCGAGELAERLFKRLPRLFGRDFDAFKELVGLGIGLTPSCDDFLAGMSAWLWIMDDDSGFCAALGNFLKQNGAEATTAVSGNLLLDVTEGYMGDTLYDTVLSAAFGDERLDENVKKLAACGASSGTETCIGILAGYYYMRG